MNQVDLNQPSLAELIDVVQEENPYAEGMKGNMRISSVAAVGGRKNQLICLGHLSVADESSIEVELLMDTNSVTNVMSLDLL